MASLTDVHRSGICIKVEQHRPQRSQGWADLAVSDGLPRVGRRAALHVASWKQTNS